MTSGGYGLFLLQEVLRVPTVEVEFWDLKKLGLELTKQELIDRLAMFGTPVDAVDGDVLRIEVNPNRPDLLSAEGIVRSIKCFIGRPPKLYPAYRPSIEVFAEEVPCRPISSFAVVRGVVMSDPLIKSIMQLQEKLHVTHGRKRAKVAIGIHDLGKATPPFKYVGKKPQDITFVPLQCDREFTGKEILANVPKGTEYGHLIENEKLWPVLVDAKGRVMALPPIINSELTRIQPETRDLFIDVTGTDPLAVEKALTIMTIALADRGAKIEQVLVRGSFDRITPDLIPKVMKIDLAYITKLLGIELDITDAATMLTKMGHFVEVKEPLEVHIAPYRTDIMHPFDLVEEVAIAYGYGNFEPVIPRVPTVAESNQLEDWVNQLRMTMVGLGFTEAFTFALSNQQKLFGNMNQSPRKVAEVLNPKTIEFTIMRDQLLPSLLEVLQSNKPAGYPQQFFEVGHVVVLDDGVDTGAQNWYRLTGAIAHAKANFTEIKSVIESLLRSLSLPEKFSPADNPSFIPGRCASFEYGVFGEVHPQVLNSWGLEVPVAAFEIDVQRIFEEKFQSNEH